jgi:hypothetical protein
VSESNRTCSICAKSEVEAEALIAFRTREHLPDGGLYYACDSCVGLFADTMATVSNKWREAQIEKLKNIKSL